MACIPLITEHERFDIEALVARLKRVADNRIAWL